MYQEFYGLRKDPFSLNPDLDFLFESSVHEEAIAHLVYGLEQKEDIIFIAGDIGTGKTLALHRLLDQLSPSVQRVSINVTTIGFEELVRLVLHKLDREPEANRPIASLLHQLEQELIRLRKQGRSVLLVIDEAQNLTLESLESVRLLLNLAQPGGQVLQIVLAGQLGLKTKLESPQLRQLRQRVKVSYTFGTLSRQESDEYILHRLRKAGREKELFRKDALERIHEMSRGVPRIVNYLASKALLSGYVVQAQFIEARHIEETPEEIDSLLGVSAVVEPQDADAPGPVPPVALEPEHKPAAPPLASANPAAEPMASRRAPSEPVRSRSRSRRWVLVVVLLALAAAAYFTHSYWLPQVQRFSNRSEVAGGGPAAEVARPEPTTADEPPRDGGNTTGAEQETLPVQDEEPTPPPAVSPGTDNAESAAVEAGTTVASDAIETQKERPTVEKPAAATAVAQVDSFVVHVASFRDAARARNFVKKLAAHGLPAYVQDSPATSRQAWHRVYIGPFAGHDRAAEIVAGLKSEGIINYSQISPR